MKRIIGIDYGRKRIGISITDPLAITAQPLTTLEYSTWKDVAGSIAGLVQEYGVGEALVGLPLLLSGDEGKMAKEVRRFAGYLEKILEVPVTLWDERLSSAATHRTLHQMGEKTGKGKGRIDRMAAALFLQTYLDRRHAAGDTAISGGDR